MPGRRAVRRTDPLLHPMASGNDSKMVHVFAAFRQFSAIFFPFEKRIKDEPSWNTPLSSSKRDRASLQGKGEEWRQRGDDNGLS